VSEPFRRTDLSDGAGSAAPRQDGADRGRRRRDSWRLPEAPFRAARPLLSPAPGVPCAIGCSSRCSTSLPFAFRRARTAVGALGLEQFDERMARWFGALSASEREQPGRFRAERRTPERAIAVRAIGSRAVEAQPAAPAASPRPLQFDSAPDASPLRPNPVFRPDELAAGQPARARRSDDDGGRARSANAFHGPRAGRLGGASARSLPGARLDRQMAAARSCPRPVASPDPGAQEDRLPRADRPMAARADAARSSSTTWRASRRAPPGITGRRRCSGCSTSISAGASITKSCSGHCSISSCGAGVSVSHERLAHLAAAAAARNEQRRDRVAAGPGAELVGPAVRLRPCAPGPAARGRSGPPWVWPLPAIGPSDAIKTVDSAERLMQGKMVVFSLRDLTLDFRRAGTAIRAPAS